MFVEGVLACLVSAGAPVGQDAFLPVTIPEGTWLATLTTDEYPVPSKALDEAQIYVNQLACFDGGGASKALYLRQIPQENSQYRERAIWNFDAGGGFSSETIIQSMDPAAVLMVEWTGQEMRKWNVTGGVPGTLHRSRPKDPKNAFTGALFLYCRDADNLDIAVQAGPPLGAVGGPSDGAFVLPLSRPFSPELVDYGSERFVLPGMGVHHLLGEMVVNRSKEALEVIWNDCLGRVVVRSNYVWRKDQLLPSELTEEFFVPGSDVIHTRRRSALVRLEGERAASGLTTFAEGQVVVDRRFGVPLQYIAEAAGELPSDASLIAHLEANSSYLAKRGGAAFKPAPATAIAMGGGETEYWVKWGVSTKWLLAGGGLVVGLLAILLLMRPSPSPNQPR